MLPLNENAAIPAPAVSELFTMSAEAALPSISIEYKSFDKSEGVIDASIIFPEFTELAANIAFVIPPFAIET